MRYYYFLTKECNMEQYGDHLITELGNGKFRAFFNSLKAVGDFENIDTAKSYLDRRSRDVGGERLTHLEKFVLVHSAVGKSAEEVSALMGLTVHAVHSHKKQICVKLISVNMINAVTRAFLGGILKNDDFTLLGKEGVAESFRELRGRDPMRFDKEIREAVRSACAEVGKETVLSALAKPVVLGQGEEN
jgi:DNA-binding CsgD family transcriptional regulator